MLTVGMSLQSNVRNILNFKNDLKMYLDYTASV